jgi:hypothetical protein
LVFAPPASINLGDDDTKGISSRQQDCEYDVDAKAKIFFQLFTTKKLGRDDCLKGLNTPESCGNPMFAETQRN